MTHSQEHIATEGLAVLAAGTLKNGRPYDIVLLAADHAPAVAALHAATIAGMSDGEKAYMLPKSLAYFSAHLSRGDGNAVMGIVSNGELIGQAMIRHPTAAAPETGMVDMPPVAPPEQLSLMQAVSLAPCARGEGLMEALACHWAAHASAWGRGHLVAEIHVDNAASWVNFLRAGLDLVGIGRDPSDGAVVYNAYERTENAPLKRVTPEFNRHAGCPAKECGFKDLAQQEALMREGYVIAGRNAAKDALVMRRIPGLSLS